jgi:hypothetical protein
MADDLYASDFYAWTQAQAEALRRRAAGAKELDYENLAEEVGDMGKSELDAVESLMTNVLVHLIKIDMSMRAEPKAHWRAEIVAFRKGWRRKLSPSVRRIAAQDLELLHRDAFEIVAAQFAAEELETPLDATRRWTLEQVLGE